MAEPCLSSSAVFPPRPLGQRFSDFDEVNHFNFRCVWRSVIRSRDIRDLVAGDNCRGGGRLQEPGRQGAGRQINSGIQSKVFLEQ